MKITSSFRMIIYSGYYKKMGHSFLTAKDFSSSEIFFPFLKKKQLNVKKTSHLMDRVLSKLLYLSWNFCDWFRIMLILQIYVSGDVLLAQSFYKGNKQTKMWKSSFGKYECIQYFCSEDIIHNLSKAVRYFHFI